jgi:hypothetical protein
MHEAIAAGCDRNEAIFRCRAEGVKLEAIAREMGGITRERIRQICNMVAGRIALAKLIEELKEENNEGRSSDNGSNTPG